MAFNKSVTSQNPSPQADKGPVGVSSPKPQQSGSFSPKGQNMPKSNSNISPKPKQQIYKDSTGTTWKQNPKQKDGIFKSKSFSPTNAPFVSSEKPAVPGATPEQGWKQKSKLELKQKSNSLANSNKQKIINQGFSPATKPAQKYKWSEGLSDADNATLNNALNKVAAWGGEKDLSRANKQWGQDLGYQLRNDGLDEENANRLSEHFLNNAPEYSEVFPGAGESPDVPHDEDYERSWGPQNDDEEEQRDFDIYNDGERLGTVKAGNEEEAMQNASGSLFFGAGDNITAEEVAEREQASKLFGTDLSKKTGPVYDPALGIAGSPSDIDDIDKMQELIDSTLQKYGRIGAGMYDDLDANGYYLDANNKVRRK